MQQYQRLTKEVIERVLNGESLATVHKDLDERREKRSDRNWLGHGLNTEAARIDELLIRGATRQKLCDEIRSLGKNNERSDTALWTRVSGHWRYYLPKKRQITVSEGNNGIYAFDRSALGVIIKNKPPHNGLRKTGNTEGKVGSVPQRTKQQKQAAEIGRESNQADLDQIASTLADEGYFSPTSLQDDRKRALREVVQRRGQPEFRKKLIHAYQGRCAATECDAVAALEAAHIVPYCGPESDHISNGLLLRADIHTLFDLNLIGIEPTTLTFAVGKELKDTAYAGLHGKPLKVPKASSQHPNPEALDQRWIAFRVAAT